LGAQLDVKSWMPPPLFHYIQEQGDIEIEEMYNVFNMGAGMIVCVDPSDVDHLLNELEGAWVIGEAKLHDGVGSKVELRRL
ncbi:MAG: hypothetical protein F4180_03895, partial [Chloroflexi bacterium]|nr:hypothetical protein [Chloroflexota bacterium]